MSETYASQSGGVWGAAPPQLVEGSTMLQSLQKIHQNTINFIKKHNLIMKFCGEREGKNWKKEMVGEGKFKVWYTFHKNIR